MKKNCDCSSFDESKRGGTSGDLANMAHADGGSAVNFCNKNRRLASSDLTLAVYIRQ